LRCLLYLLVGSADAEYVTLPHLFRSESGLSGRIYWTLRNPVDYFFVCTIPL
jgi:hypothetical protein